MSDLEREALVRKRVSKRHRTESSFAKVWTILKGSDREVIMSSYEKEYYEEYPTTKLVNYSTNPLISVTKKLYIGTLGEVDKKESVDKELVIRKRKYCIPFYVTKKW